MVRSTTIERLAIVTIERVCVTCGGTFAAVALERRCWRCRAPLIPAPRKRTERPPSPRQCDLLDAITEGLENKEIGHKLGLAQGSVKALLFKLYEKLGVHGRVGAVLWWAHHRGEWVRGNGEGI